MMMMMMMMSLVFTVNYAENNMLYYPVIWHPAYVTKEV